MKPHNSRKRTHERKFSFQTKNSLDQDQKKKILQNKFN